jgi:hypothetical protein
MFEVASLSKSALNLRYIIYLKAENDDLIG